MQLRNNGMIFNLLIVENDIEMVDINEEGVDITHGINERENEKVLETIGKKDPVQLDIIEVNEAPILDTLVKTNAEIIAKNEEKDAGITDTTMKKIL